MLGLNKPIYEKTAAYGHFGRESEKKEVEVYYEGEGVKKKDSKLYKEVETFAWEKLDMVEKLVKAFELNEAPALEKAAY